LEPSLYVVFNWIIRFYTILVWNTISGFSNLDICFYHCLILTLIFHLKVLINFFFFFITTTTTTTTTITTTTINIIIIIIIIIIVTIVVVIVVVLLLSIIYTINLPMVRPRSHRVIYYFDTPALGRRHQSFSRVTTVKAWLVVPGCCLGLVAPPASTSISCHYSWMFISSKSKIYTNFSLIISFITNPFS
jgi:hypothetical protein